MNDPHFFNDINQIYWINLERAKERCEKMEQMFQDPLFDGIPINRIEAFDGSKHNAMHYFIMDSIPKMTNIEYACLLSHLNTIEQFIESSNNKDTDVALVLEDDMTLEFRPYWQKTIKQIMKDAPPDWEVLQITYIINDHLPNNEYDEEKFWSTGAYLIKKSAAKKLIDSILVKRLDNEPQYFDLKKYPIHQADYLIYTLKTYLYKYPVFIYEYNNISYLNEEESLLLARNYSKSMILKMMEDEIYNK
jgi:GR25 family glycosyltransferase involved in LPS biosynthesis